MVRARWLLAVRVAGAGRWAMGRRGDAPLRHGVVDIRYTLLSRSSLHPRSRDHHNSKPQPGRPEEAGKRKGARTASSVLLLSSRLLARIQ